ncbi:hypothetical protein [Komagataeibacter intermedius]|uniref:hypothetical protein n=1 Tax=Komagataeibacter intermedius TaxID=66229 RepID=UPI003B429824
MTQKLPSEHDPIVAVRSAAFGARNLPFIHFHPTAKSGPSAEEVIREIKRLFKIEKNPPTVTRAEGRLTRKLPATDALLNTSGLVQL